MNGESQKARETFRVNYESDKGTLKKMKMKNNYDNGKKQ